jgi:hypothetical protein
MQRVRASEATNHQSSWWQVMCLTGVDYFSSLSYTPGIAFLAAGLLSPLATIILILLTLFGALPIYKRVASRSPHGQGSISMLERLSPGWYSKLTVLCLLGFAATDFIITITLSSADAATHLAKNPIMPLWMHDQMGMTLIMVITLSAVFFIGFREAIGIAVLLVFTYLMLSVIVLLDASYYLFVHGTLIENWWHQLFVLHGSIWQMLAISCLLFPKLALGLSGFETGVAVMPLVKGDPDDDQELPQGRIRNTKQLLSCAALIMSVLLLVSSIVTCLLIPEKEFLPNGAANGRAISYLAHHYLGHYFGTAYDISSILILWFAGASAMAGLLNLVPRYLPRYGMAPEWARARRPLVIFFALVCIAVTVIFHADVDAQGAAYATGVLVLMTSAAVASFLTSLKESLLQRAVFLLTTCVFFYTTVINAFERPDGIKIALFFIVTIYFSSFVSRIMRSTELRTRRVILDPQARQIIKHTDTALQLVAHRPGIGNYEQKVRNISTTHSIGAKDIIFVEVSISDSSNFGDETLRITGETIGEYKVLKCSSTAIPNALAVVMLYLRDKTLYVPHIYLGWTEGNPIISILKYLILGEGEIAPLTREILRKSEPNPDRRPMVHVS